MASAQENLRKAQAVVEQCKIEVLNCKIAEAEVKMFVVLLR